MNEEEYGKRTWGHIAQGMRVQLNRKFYSDSDLDHVHKRAGGLRCDSSGDASACDGAVLRTDPVITLASRRCFDCGRFEMCQQVAGDFFRVFNGNEMAGVQLDQFGI